MAEPEIPSYFLCPISYQIMRDPVTLSTGITYDRGSIEQWLFAGGHSSCPVTNQPLHAGFDLTPNHTLRRLIQGWCVAHSVERFPTPRPPVDQARIAGLIGKTRSSDPPQTQLQHLQELKSVAFESERNRRCVGSSHAALDYLAAFVAASDDGYRIEAAGEAVSILNSLEISDQGLIDLVARCEDLIDSLTRALRSFKNPESRADAMMLLRSVVAVISPARLAGVNEETFVEIVRMLRDHDQITVQAKKAALETLMGLCPWGRNRIKAVGAGAVHVLIELLMEDREEKRAAEMALAVLDKLCGCAEGRAEVVGHAAGIAAVSKKILRVSGSGSGRAVRVLHSVARYSATAAVLQEMAQVGAVAKLCMVLVVPDCGVKTKERAREVLRMHARVWRSSPCLSPQLQALYPC